MQVIRITTDNQAEILTIDDGDASRRLAQLQAAVDGPRIEYVSISDSFELIVDEESLLADKPLNYYGTLIPRLFDVPVSGICGDVLLVGRIDGDDGAEVTDAPAIAYETLARFGFQLEQPK